MEFHQIRYFLKAAENLNFTRAAEQCHVSQPALTRAIQKLEDEFGGDLFVRNGRAVTLSPLGDLMREHLQRIQATRELARAAAKTFLDEGVAELNVGVMCTIGPDLLTAFIDDFRNRHLDVLLILHDVEPKALSKLLLSGFLDLAFIAQYRDQERDGVSAQVLFEETMGVAFGETHRFAAMDDITLFDIAEEPYLDRLNCELRQPFCEFMSDNGLELRIACSSAREDWIQAMIMRGLGVSIMPRFSVISRRLGWRKLSGPLSGRRKITIARADAVSSQPAATAFFSDAVGFSWDNALQANGGDTR
ncbi:MAG: LysR family transcriptional regulator [Paracoccaceae bacterium]|nr:LysR family transcriptional regulator [Paracoccaceae bacterium]